MTTSVLLIPVHVGVFADDGYPYSMTWKNESPALESVVQLLTLNLEMEQRKLLSEIRAFEGQAKAAGIKVAPLQRKEARPVQYAFPPLKHLSVVTKGSF